MRQIGAFTAGGKVELGLYQLTNVEFIAENGGGAAVRLRKVERGAKFAMDIYNAMKLICGQCGNETIDPVRGLCPACYERQRRK